MKRLALAAALLAGLALPTRALAQSANPPWQPDCHYLSQYGLGDPLVQCDQVLFTFQQTPQGVPYVHVTDYGSGAEYDIPPALFVAVHNPEYQYVWIDTTAQSICGVQFGSHFPFVSCVDNRPS